MGVPWIIYAQINYGRIRLQSQLFNFNYVRIKIRPKTPPSHWLDDGSAGSKCWSSVEYQMIISLLANDSNSGLPFSFSLSPSSASRYTKVIKKIEVHCISPLKINNKHGICAAFVYRLDLLWSKNHSQRRCSIRDDANGNPLKPTDNLKFKQFFDISRRFYAQMRVVARVELEFRLDFP